MKVVLCKAFGEPSTLVVEEVPSPKVSGGEVRIAVRAAGVNFPDTLMVRGQYQFKPPFPFSPGLEVAGDVLEVGEGVTHVKVGDRVIGIVNYGGFAEEVVAPAVMTLPMPANMDYASGAGFSLTYGTSHVALDHRGNLQVGETLLVLGAAGGVGLTAVELCKLMGATVIAAASTAEKLEVAQQYGADYLINYSGENIRERIKEITGGKGVNVVYDPVGGDLFEPTLRSVAWEGRYLVIGFASGTIPQLPANLPLLKNCSVVGVFWGAYALNKPKVLTDSLATLLKWYGEGKLKPHISRTYPLEQAADALYALINRQSTGKVVLTTQ
jgi:NADPH2:quinone reductase